MFLSRLIFIVLGIFFVLSFFDWGNYLSGNKNNVSYSQFLQDVYSGSMEKVEIKGLNIKAYFSDGSSYEVIRPYIEDSRLVDDLLHNNVQIAGKNPNNRGFIEQLLIASFPVILLFLFLMFLLKNIPSGGSRGNPLSFGRSKAKLVTEEKINIKFKDVQGIESVKQEVHEVVDFLKSPNLYSKMGAKIPKGIMMIGPPGTGKTMLAKAIAGESGVPFFFTSGSDFLEMFVGIGAARVRDMFEQAKRKAPCILFIDEIDAVGRQRGSGIGGGNDEREQTLNQLLIEMDGFEEKTGVIVIAATNRHDILDKALLRPGRFDRMVYFNLPDIMGREAILKVHCKKVVLAKSVDMMAIARGTAGFSGADLANLVNEAALIAVRRRGRKINYYDFEEAKDKIMMGTKRDIIMSDEERERTAYHEAGHAIIGYLLPKQDPIHKVTIMPRGNALGVTMFLPEKDNYSVSLEYIRGSIVTLYGGRVAELLVYGKDGISTGAENDIKEATRLAENFVLKWGFSEELGPRLYSTSSSSINPLYENKSDSSKHSDETQKKIDSEINVLISLSYNKAMKILKENRKILENMKDALLKYEVIDKEQIALLMRGESFVQFDEYCQQKIKREKEEQKKAMLQEKQEEKEKEKNKSDSTNTKSSKDDSSKKKIVVKEELKDKDPKDLVH